MIAPDILTSEQRARVNAAVAAAQSRTQARFAFVVVPASDRYHLYPVLWGAGVAFVALGLIALIYPHLGVRMAFTIVTAIFLILSLVLEWAPFRLRLAPRRVRHAHAHALAHREFAVRILGHEEHQAGVLFFVSLAERYSEIIATHGLHKAAGQAAWDAIVSNFTASAAQGKFAEGFVAGADACGALLEQHHPKG